MSLIETHQQEHQRHQQEHQRKARCNYPINYLKFYWHCLSGVLCIWELFSNRILVYVSGGILKTKDTTGRPEVTQGYAGVSSILRIPKECLSMIWQRDFPLSYHVALFRINRTHDRPAETFVYVVFHSMRIMYVSLWYNTSNLPWEARWGVIRWL